MSDLKQQVELLLSDFSELKPSLAVEEKKASLNKLEAASTDPDLWKDQDHARGIMQQIGDIRNELESINKLEEGLKTLSELGQTNALDESFAGEISSLAKLLSNIKLQSFLSGIYDSKNAILSLHAGQGGTEAMDWTQMLYRMYLRYCERRGWETETIDYSPGEEAGIKSVTFKVAGTYAYGYLKGESGTHRLVRQSPFNADKLRQTSFALVGVMPDLEETDLPEVVIKDEDCQWQFFHSSSQGGQNVQKVSTAVRLTHLPTGMVVTAQTERFQEQNRKIALGLLRAKLWLLEEERKKAQVKAIKGEYRPASWGNQIRSYVLHPYKMVKDLRTKVETGNTDGVLDGAIEVFIEADIKLGK